MQTSFKPTEADIQIRDCLDHGINFSVIAGAGSGKTTSLVTALHYLREQKEAEFKRDAKKIACITFTNRAVEVISERLGWDELYLVSTLHSFLWGEIKRFTTDIKRCLKETLIPEQIAKYKERDNGGNSQTALTAREKALLLEIDLIALDDVKQFKYDDTSSFSDYAKGRLSHDDIIAISGLMITQNEILQKIIGQKYPYIFVDEAQDTFDDVVSAFNAVCAADGLPIVGYFGDPMQQIYDKRAGDFCGPEGSRPITKRENFRCSPEVINLLNAFRDDVQQFPAGDNAEIKGSVELILVEAEAPEAPRNRYSDEQLDRVSSKFQQITDSFGWGDEDDVKFLFLVRQMIARRLGFSELNKLFTGQYASTKAQDDYQTGEHILIKPLLRFIWPVVQSYKSEDMRSVMNLLRTYSPAFDPEGQNSNKPVGEMLSTANALVKELYDCWNSKSLRAIYKFIHDNQLYNFPERLTDDLCRDPMPEEYDKKQHSEEKGRWLVDCFFEMDSSQLDKYVQFVNDNTPYSTQHGVKGEEYPNVAVVFDDTEAAWNLYSFTKTLIPSTAGEGTEGQVNRSRKLTYVCFSRAEVNLKVILFTQNPEAAKQELIAASLFEDGQISIHQ